MEQPILNTDHVHIAIGKGENGPAVTIDSGLGFMEHPHFPGSMMMAFGSFDNAIDCLRITIRSLERTRDDLNRGSTAAT